MNPINSGAGAAGIRDIIALRQQIIDQSKVLQQLNAPGAVQEGTQATGSTTGGFAENLRSALDKVNRSKRGDYRQYYDQALIDALDAVARAAARHPEHPRLRADCEAFGDAQRRRVLRVTDAEIASGDTATSQEAFAAVLANEL